VKGLEDAITGMLWEDKRRAGLLASLGLRAIMPAAMGLYEVVAVRCPSATRELETCAWPCELRPATVQWIVLAHGVRLGIAGGLPLKCVGP